MKIKLLILTFAITSLSFSQENAFQEKAVTINEFIDGSLLLPDTTKAIPLVIIIAGSGPTDRNGNQTFLKNNSLKFLAEALYKKGIATFRYDKRIFKLLKQGNLKEENIDFDDFITDAQSVVNFFKNDNRFSKLIIAGHSQGSLVGMIVSQNDVDAFISLAGAGQEIDDVIVDQLAKQAPALKDDARLAFDDLRVYGTVTNLKPELASILRPSVQPFINSWMQYNPQTEINKLTIPVLIINGDKDMQVQISEAENLKEALPTSKLIIIPNMNHILKEVKTDDLLENQQTYSNPDLPVVAQLITEISVFINNL